jgi:hypothetical protein
MKQRSNSKPIVQKVPPFAPEGSVPLDTMLDEVGKVVEPSWTGGEVAAEPVIERSDAELETTAFVDFMREGETRSEAEILAELRDHYETETAPGRRRQAVVDQCRQLLHRGLLPSIAFGSNGKIFQVPSHIWAANGAEEIFNTGILVVQDGEVTFRRGLTQGDNTAVVLIKTADLNRVVKRLTAGESLATLAPLEERTGTSLPETGLAYPYLSGYQGRPSLKDPIQREFSRRANEDKCAGSLGQEARDLLAWLIQAHPDAPHKPTAKTIENQIRDQYRQHRRHGSTK